ncbi:unnamed protein product [Lactuca saligna]|uniref:Uncharacterized protein n=1 Tax=Lactuca saligna TaxID=75948 RepID=A0AA35YWT8_LACSI|nr:unnamed protein product [Lactuca saligna]
MRVGGTYLAIMPTPTPFHPPADISFTLVSLPCVFLLATAEASRRTPSLLHRKVSMVVGWSIAVTNHQTSTVVSIVAGGGGRRWSIVQSEAAGDKS